MPHAFRVDPATLPAAGCSSAEVQRNCNMGTHLYSTLEYIENLYPNVHARPSPKIAFFPIEGDEGLSHPSSRPALATSGAMHVFKTKRQIDPLAPKYVLPGMLEKRPHSEQKLLPTRSENEWRPATSLSECVVQTSSAEQPTGQSNTVENVYNSRNSRSIMASRQTRKILDISDIPGATRPPARRQRMLTSLSTSDIPGASPKRMTRERSPGRISYDEVIPGSSPGNYRAAEHPLSFSTTYATGRWPSPSPPQWYFARQNRRTVLQKPLCIVE